MIEVGSRVRRRVIHADTVYRYGTVTALYRTDRAPVVQRWWEVKWDGAPLPPRVVMESALVLLSTLEALAEAAE